MPRVLYTGVLAAALLSVGAVAQTPAFTFNTSTRLVIEAVTVTERNGNPIAGLTANDFTLTEDGVAQPVAFCNYQQLGETIAAAALPPVPAATAPPPTAVRIVPEVPGGANYSNRRLIALYFDLASMSFGSRMRAIQAARKFIGNGMHSADLVAILAYRGAGVRVLSGFTHDPDQLGQALQHLLPSRLQGESALAASAASTTGAFGQDGQLFDLFSSNRHLDALRTAINKLARIRERKSLVYFADGLNLTVDNEAELQATVNAAINANVQIFPDDTRGLMATPPGGSAAEAAPAGGSVYTGAAQQAAELSVPHSQDSLYALGSDTGGAATLDTNDLARGIARARNAIGDYYEIGYYTTHTAKDGSYRHIRISVSGHPHAHIRYRKGYYAAKTFATFTQADKERQLENALLLPNPITDLDLQLRVHYFQIDPAEYFVPLAIKIPGRQLALTRHGVEHTATIDFIGEVKDAYGTTMTNLRDHVQVQLNAPTAAALKQSALEYTSGFTLLPGHYSVKVLARDDANGLIGTYIKKFTVPNLARVADRLPLSSLVISDQSEPVAASANGRRTNIAQQQVLAASPLVFQGVQLMPSVQRTFTRSQRLTFLLQAYEHPPAHASPLEAFVGFYQNRKLVYETPARVIASAPSGQAGAISIRLTVALQHLQAGTFVVQVTVLDPARQLANFRRAGIVVTAPQ